MTKLFEASLHLAPEKTSAVDMAQEMPGRVPAASDPPRSSGYDAGPPAVATKAKKAAKTSPVRFLLLNLLFHIVYISSIFDIYFTSSVVPHIESVTDTDAPPAKRIVVLVAVGCRADKVFEANASYDDAAEHRSL